MQLTKAEEQVMKYLWNQEKAFMKDLLNAFPEPKPATTTVATLLRRMIDKDVVGYTQYSNVRQYYPKIKREININIKIKRYEKTYFNYSNHPGSMYIICSNY